MELGAIPCVSESSPVGEEPPAGPFESRRAAERMNDTPRRAEIVAVVDDDRLRQATTPRRGPGKILVALLGVYVTIDLVGHVVGYFRDEAEAETEAEPQAQKGVAALASERSVDAVDAPQHSPESQVIDSELRLSNTASCVRRRERRRLRSAVEDRPSKAPRSPRARAHAPDETAISTHPETAQRRPTLFSLHGAHEAVGTVFGGFTPGPVHHGSSWSQRPRLATHSSQGSFIAASCSHTMVASSFRSLFT